MDEVEWWEFDTPAEMAEQAAGDIGFVIERAIEAHGGARLALPGGKAAEPVWAALAQNKGFDWAKLTILPTDERLVAPDHEASNARRLKGWFGAAGAEIVPLVDGRSDDAEQAGREADARLSLLNWPLDLVCLAVGEDGHTASIFPGPDFDRAVNGPRERRAIGVRPDPKPSDAPYDRVTLTAPALSSARAVMVILSGSATREAVEQAIKEGPLSATPIGRVIAAIEAPIDIFWTP